MAFLGSGEGLNDVGTVDDGVTATKGILVDFADPFSLADALPLVMAGDCGGVPTPFF